MVQKMVRKRVQKMVRKIVRKLVQKIVQKIVQWSKGPIVQSLFYLRHRNCGATSVGEYKWLIKYHQLSWWRKLATVKNFKAEVSKLLTVANLITLSCPQFFQKKQVSTRMDTKLC